MKKITYFLIAAAVVLHSLTNASVVLAAQPPEFRSCLNPQGEVKADYSTGMHGIVGQEYLFQGADKVYTLSSDAQLQCFCPEDGNAIQTDWWKASDLSADEIKSYEGQGWILVPDGSKWGLSSNPYLARNSRYSCKSTTTTTTTNNNTTNNNTTNNNTTNNNTTNNNTTNNYSTGQVLALASTGNIMFIYLLTGTGIICVLMGILLQMKLKK